MGLGIDIGIDANGDGRAFAKRRCNVAQLIEFRFAFDVEAEDAFAQRKRHVFAGLADAGENDFRCRYASRAGTPQLAFRDDVHTSAKVRQRRQDRLVRVGFDRKTNERVDALKGLGQHLVVALERRGRIAIKRRSNLGGYLRKADVLGVEHARFVMEVVHGNGFSRNPSRGKGPWTYLRSRCLLSNVIPLPHARRRDDVAGPISTAAADRG